MTERLSRPFCPVCGDPADEIGSGAIPDSMTFRNGDGWCQDSTVTGFGGEDLGARMHFWGVHRRRVSATPEGESDG